MSKPDLICVRVEPELAAEVKVEADRDRRTVSAYVRNLLEDTIAAKRAETALGVAR